jgi:hypothetical protein
VSAGLTLGCPGVRRQEVGQAFAIDGLCTGGIDTAESTKSEHEGDRATLPGQILRRANIATVDALRWSPATRAIARRCRDSRLHRDGVSPEADVFNRNVRRLEKKGGAVASIARTPGSRRQVHAVCPLFYGLQLHQKCGRTDLGAGSHELI